MTKPGLEAPWADHARWRAKTSARRFGSHLLIFAGLGPPIGSLPVVLGLTFAEFTAWAVQGESSQPLQVFAVALWIVMMSYLAGGLPAVLTGAIASVLPRSSRARFALLTGLIGALATTVSWSVFLIRSVDQSAILLFGSGVITGGAGGLVCACITFSRVGSARLPAVE